MVACLCDVVFIRRDIVHDSIDSALLEVEEGIRECVVDLHVGAFDLSGSFFAGGADRHAKDFALEVVSGLDGIIVCLDDDAEACDVVALGEIDGFFAVRGDGDIVDGCINDAGLERRDQAVESNVVDFRFKAFCLADGADDIDIEAFIRFRFRVLEAERRIRCVHADADDLTVGRSRRSRRFACAIAAAGSKAECQAGYDEEKPFQKPFHKNTSGEISFHPLIREADYVR